MGKPKVGRVSIFRGKILSKEGRLALFLTRRGIQLFGQRRREVSKWVGIPIDSLSQADVIEAVLRGEEETKREAEKG